MGFRDSLGSTNALMFVILFVGINGLVEAVVNFIIGAVVSKSLYYIFNQRKLKEEQKDQEMDTNTEIE